MCIVISSNSLMLRGCHGFRFPHIEAYSPLGFVANPCACPCPVVLLRILWHFGSLASPLEDFLCETGTRDKKESGNGRERTKPRVTAKASVASTIGMLDLPSEHVDVWHTHTYTQTHLTSANSMSCASIVTANSGSVNEVRSCEAG